jgi:integrase
MPRKVRDKALDSREARSKLPARGKPYWRSIGKGLHLGYRRLRNIAGTWSTRLYHPQEDGKYKYSVELLGTADDFVEADGVSVLDFWQAQELAQKRFRSTGKSVGPYSVSAALDDYLANLEADGRTPIALAENRRAIDKLIRPKLGHIIAAVLKAKDIQLWLNNLATTPSSKRGDKPNDDDAKRARRASANRVLNLLKAALNSAHERGDIVDDKAWAAIKAFGGVHKARTDFLSIEEATRLTNAAEPEFRPILKAALLTGARYGGLAQLRVRDFDRKAGTVAVQSRKGSGELHVYHAVLTNEGVRFFESVCAGRSRDDLIFTHADGSPWIKSQQVYPMSKACKAARIKPAVGFHQLRHSYASLAIMAGMPEMVVAQNLGHSDTKMIMRHYGHLTASYKKKVIQELMPTFGFETDRKITPIR